MLTYDHKKAYIEDLNSTHGTFVNGVRIEKKTELKQEDRVRLGVQLFHWRDHLDGDEDELPVYMKDLFFPKGIVRWQDYKFILLLTLGILLVIPLGVPTFLILLEQQIMTKIPELKGAINLLSLLEMILWVIGIVIFYVFVNLTQKMTRWKMMKGK